MSLLVYLSVIYLCAKHSVEVSKSGQTPLWSLLVAAGASFTMGWHQR